VRVPLVAASSPASEAPGRPSDGASEASNFHYYFLSHRPDFISRLDYYGYIRNFQEN
jgi:hypothetical protein